MRQTRTNRKNRSSRALRSLRNKKGGSRNKRRVRTKSNRKRKQRGGGGDGELKDATHEMISSSQKVVDLAEKAKTPEERQIAIESLQQSQKLMEERLRKMKELVNSFKND